MNLRRLLGFGRTPGGQPGRDEQRRRILLYLLGLVVVLLAYTVLYRWTVLLFEGVEISYVKALLTVVESFTTTGYGEDAALWTTPVVQLLLVSMQLTGVAMIFLALPVFVAPWVESRLSPIAPTAVEELSDHVVIAGYSPRGRELVRELRTRDRPYVVIEPDRDLANELHAETALTVIHGDPKLSETLAAANADTARAVVADIGDEANASIALAATGVDGAGAPETDSGPGSGDRSRDGDGPQVVTFVEDSTVADYHRYAGADAAFSPRQLIGESLARKVTAGVRPELEDAVELAEDFDIVELPVQAGSELVGVTVEESDIRERTGTNVIGAWFRGEFVSPPPPDALIDTQTILVAAGREEGLERLKRLTRSEQRGIGESDQRVVVAGFDEVGNAVVDAIDGQVPVTIVDRRELPDVDVVGDITDESTLREAVADADTVILAVSDDTTAVFATLVLRELDPDIEVIARADATESVRKLYQAGADYVLALSTVAGRMLASTILNEDVISFDQQVELVRVGCGNLAGRSLAEADVRARTGVTVVAVERDEAFITDLGPEFVVREGDELVVTGTDDDVNRFTAFIE